MGHRHNDRKAISDGFTAMCRLAMPSLSWRWVGRHGCAAARVEGVGEIYLTPTDEKVVGIMAITGEGDCAASAPWMRPVGLTPVECVERLCGRLRQRSGRRAEQHHALIAAGETSTPSHARSARIMAWVLSLAPHLEATSLERLPLRSPPRRVDIWRRFYALQKEAHHG